VLTVSTKNTASKKKSTNNIKHPLEPMLIAGVFL